MPRLNTLRNSFEKFRTDIENKRKIADDLINTAETHKASGDEVQAAIEHKSAERYQSDIQQAESAMAAILVQIQMKERKVKEVKDKLVQLDSDYKRQRDQLEGELKQVS